MMTAQVFKKISIGCLLGCLLCLQLQRADGQGNWFKHNVVIEIIIIITDFLLKEGVYLELNGINYSNNSYVNISDIGTDSLALLCKTDLQICCKNPNRGEWYFPNSSLVSRKGSEKDFYRDRGDQVVRLHRRNNATMPVGEYCCEVFNANFTNETVCITVTSPVEMPAGERIN